MKIKIKLYGNFLKNGPPESFMNVPSGSNILYLLDKLGVKERSYIMILINLKRSWFNTVLKDGDEVSIFAPVGGG